jgi:hypothetical protein
VPVDGGGDALLRRLVGDDFGGGQPLQELPEPRVARFERSQFLEQVLSGPVAGVAEHMLVDPVAQARGTGGPRVARGVQHPQAVQEGLEPVRPDPQDVEVAVLGELAPGPPRDLDSTLAGP